MFIPRYIKPCNLEIFKKTIKLMSRFMYNSRAKFVISISSRVGLAAPARQPITRPAGCLTVQASC